MYGERLTKKDCIDYVVNEVSAKYYCQVTDVIQVDETPEFIRHSCFSTGLAFLGLELCQIRLNYVHGVIEIPYYFCVACGKLYLHIPDIC